MTLTPEGKRDADPGTFRNLAWKREKL